MLAEGRGSHKRTEESCVLLTGLAVHTAQSRCLCCVLSPGLHSVFHSRFCSVLPRSALFCSLALSRTALPSHLPALFPVHCMLCVPSETRRAPRDTSKSLPTLPLPFSRSWSPSLLCTSPSPPHLVSSLSFAFASLAISCAPLLIFSRAARQPDVLFLWASASKPPRTP